MAYSAKLGWDKNLKLRARMKLFELRAAISRHVPRKSGRLARAVNTSQNYKFTGSDDIPEVTMTVDLPYADIQDGGGTVNAVYGKRMRMPWGVRMSRASSTIPGHRYTERGVQDFLASANGFEVGFA